MYFTSFAVARVLTSEKQWQKEIVTLEYDANGDILTDEREEKYPGTDLDGEPHS